MANVCIVLGPSGTGKSTSIKGLDPKETVIINVLNKRLPFKGSVKMYNEQSANLFNLETYSDIINMVNNISSDKNAAFIKNVVIDDMIYTMRKEFFEKATVKGYDKFTELAQHFQEIAKTCEHARNDLNIFFILHTEDVVSDGAIVAYKVATVGKMIDNQYQPIEVVPLVLVSMAKMDAKGNTEYGFFTHRTKYEGVLIPAKTPEDMFKDDFIPNDLGLVVKTMNEYYNAEDSVE